ncbi:IS30 family transposase [Parafannyhessea umbonata]|uniref:Integrase catalytic domain-containing protein n=1 Tax=Parafannyhessea umbonata TaxID=604330 RepID=A0A1H1LX36_9ACTN|nr:IS30 family transposase [Parafannyhessea umbonata]SDR78967.1 hypothetical protein SAMN04489857_1176 [Parafannyhessea umbonata]
MPRDRQGRPRPGDAGRPARRFLRHHGRRRHASGKPKGAYGAHVTHEMFERPPVVARRSRIGDWEGDTVAGCEGGACLVTQVDRRSGYLMGGKAAHKTSAEVGGATMGSLAGMVVRSITVDRGSEFACATSLQEGPGAPVCLCDSHQPWQRGTNENTNGLLRDWFPKGEEPRRRHRRGGPGGVRFPQPQTPQAPGVEVPLRSLLSPIVALAVRIHNGNC